MRKSFKHTICIKIINHWHKTIHLVVWQGIQVWSNVGLQFIENNRFFNYYIYSIDQLIWSESIFLHVKIGATCMLWSFSRTNPCMLLELCCPFPASSKTSFSSSLLLLPIILFISLVGSSSVKTPLLWIMNNDTAFSFPSSNSLCNEYKMITNSKTNQIGGEITFFSLFLFIFWVTPTTAHKLK